MKKRFHTRDASRRPPQGVGPSVLLLIIAAALTPALPTSAEETVRRIVDVQAQALRQEARAQQQIDQLDDETKRLLNEWRDAEQRIATLDPFIAQMQQQTAAQLARVERLQTALDHVSELERQMLPLMQEMAAMLRRFVQADLPFRRAERLSALERVDAVLARPDLDQGEKFRQLMDAWLAEAEYGTTLEAWAGDIELENGRQQVTFLRLGRIAWYYQALDGQSGGIWHAADERWHPLEGSQLRGLRKAILVAQEELAPELLPLPVPAARRTQP